jgi:hypothetical protein
VTQSLPSRSLYDLVAALPETNGVEQQREVARVT